MFLYLVVAMILVTSTLIFVYGGESVEDRWLERENLWKEKEIEWEAELNNLEKEKEQLELVLSKHFIDHNKLHILPYSESNHHAIVTVFGTDKEEYSPAWVNALILFQSLKETKCRVPNKVAISWLSLDTIPRYAKNSFKRLGVDLRYVGDHKPNNVHSEDWRKAWLRSQVFGLTEFSQVLFMDAETIAIDNIDHVFEIPVPSDHNGDPHRLVFNALNQENCEHYDSCHERRAPSARFFMIRPDEKVAKEVEQRVSSKSSDLLLRDLFSTTMHEILVWTPFPNDSFDWEVGECECPTFKKK